MALPSLPGPGSSVDRAAVLEIARESVDWRACRERGADRGKVTAVVVFACARETRNKKFFLSLKGVGCQN
jgi:hypothetical protein